MYVLQNDDYDGTATTGDFPSRRWGSSVAGLRTLDPQLSPQELIKNSFEIIKNL